jgi:hypothetical protein
MMRLRSRRLEGRVGRALEHRVEGMPSYNTVAVDGAAVAAADGVG